MIVIDEYMEEGLDKVARKLLENFGYLKVWCFFGEMGAGKTTLIRAIIKNMGNPSQASSPTFAIVNEYLSHTNAPIYHFDFYRLIGLEEAIDIGVEEYLCSGNYCFCEWPDIVLPILSEPYVHIQLEWASINTRTLKIKTIQ